MKYTHSLKFKSLVFVSLTLVFLLVSGAATAANAQGHGRGGGGMGGRSRGGQSKGSGGSDTSMEAVNAANEKVKQADAEMRQYPGLAQGLNMSETQLHDGYQAALVNNLNLKFDQYLTANRIALNLGKDHQNITADAILDGLAGGKNIGQQLQALGLSAKDAKEAEKEADRQIKESKKQK